MTSAPMHNPLPDTDLFGLPDSADAFAYGIDAAAGPDSPAHQLVCMGTLSRDAEVRVKPVGPQGNAAPVLCLDLQDVTPQASAVHIEQVFTNADRAKAEATAARLRKGMRVSARCAMQDVRLSLTNAFAIEAQPPLPTHSTRKHP